MATNIVNLGIAAITLGIAYALMSEGLWGAALMFFNILFAGVIAFNFYEPLAKLVAANMSFAAGYADLVCMMGIFLVSLIIFRLTTETLAPSMVRFPPPVYHIGRVAFGFAGGVLTMAIILMAFNLAPIHKKLFSVAGYDYKLPFGMGIDRGWLGFFQYTTGFIFPSYGSSRDPYSEYGTAKVFDPR